MIAFAKDYYPPAPVPCMFIGGPWDGHVHEMDKVYMYWEVAKPRPFRLCRCEDDLSRVTRDIVTYRACYFSCGRDNPEFVFYVAHPLTAVHVMHRLWDNYAKKEKVRT